MQSKLQEIAEKIYREGVSKGNEEADKIIANSRDESEKIISEAGLKAAAIISDAKQEAEELKAKSLAGIKLSFRQALNTLKQEVEEAVSFKLVDEPVKEVFSDNRFIARLIEKIAEKWTPGDNEAGVEISLPEEMISDLEKYLGKRTGDILNKGIILKPVKSMGKGFEIHPSGKGYKISVTESDFTGFIKEILRPRLVDLLFENDRG